MKQSLPSYLTKKSPILLEYDHRKQKTSGNPIRNFTRLWILSDRLPFNTFRAGLDTEGRRAGGLLDTTYGQRACSQFLLYQITMSRFLGWYDRRKTEQGSLDSATSNTPSNHQNATQALEQTDPSRTASKNTAESFLIRSSKSIHLPILNAVALPSYRTKTIIIRDVYIQLQHLRARGYLMMLPVWCTAHDLLRSVPETTLSDYVYCTSLNIRLSYTPCARTPT